MNPSRHTPSPPVRRRPRLSPAFSLIELILVITIISIMASIGVPMYANALARYRVDAAASRLITDLEYARRYAGSISTGVMVQFKADSDLVTLLGVPDQNNPGTDWTLALADRPYYTDLLSTTFSGSTVTFNGYGFPDTDGSIVLTVGAETRTVVLNADTGKAEVQ